MDLQNAGNYKYYKCRSLLACDTGGTVYDTSKRCDNSVYNTNFLRYKNGSQPEPGQSDNIIYIIGTKSKFEDESRSLVDLTTHLDDDKFNDYEMYSHTNLELEKQAIQYIPGDDGYFKPQDRQYIQNKNFDYYPLENNSYIEDYKPVLDNDNAVFIQDNEHFLNSDSLNNVVSAKHINGDTRKNSSSTESDIIYEPSDTYFQYFSSHQNNCYSLNSNHISNQGVNEYDYDLQFKTEFEANKKHINKRKQIYTVKDDSFTELLDENNSTSNKANFSNKCKKKKSVYNKENHKDKMQHQKLNPFANLKLSSILKGNKKRAMKKNRDCSKQWQNESTVSSNNENVIQSNNNNDEEILICKQKSLEIDYYSPFNSKDIVLQELDTVINLNSELTSADYLEYVQPRERIIESNMDKLLSPTIEVEFSEFLQPHTVKQLLKEKPCQIDCNGNEVGFQNFQKTSNPNSLLSASEIVEKELYLKSAYAKKLGFENYFNTSNESVINEILFGAAFNYMERELNRNNLNDSDKYLRQNHLMDKSFKSVSCTLLESINEFNRFGGFAEENCEHKAQETKEDSRFIFVNDRPVHFCQTDRFQKENEHLNFQHNMKETEQTKSNFTFNFSNKSDLLGLDYPSRCRSFNYLSSTNTDIKRSAPLIIKIKKVNDENNEYVIDDSSGLSKKVVHKSCKSIERYECYDCSMKFRTKRILKNHISENHRGPYHTECEICHMKYRKSSAHKRHQPWCIKNVTHKCDICNKVYCYKASLAKHLKTHKRCSKLGSLST